MPRAAANASGPARFAQETQSQNRVIDEIDSCNEMVDWLLVVTTWLENAVMRGTSEYAATENPLSRFAVSWSEATAKLASSARAKAINALVWATVVGLVSDETLASFLGRSLLHQLRRTGTLKSRKDIECRQVERA